MLASGALDFQKTRYARFMNHRVPSNRRYQPTEYEHAANCATHAFWILPSILGSSILYVLSDDRWETISAWIYGFGLSSLFIVSTIFHTISWKKRHLRTVEHCLHMFDRMVIYFFIAASYAPWLNLRELGPWASHMRWIIWIMASVGTVYVFFFHERYKLVELVCYVIMGFFPALVILSMGRPPRAGGWRDFLLPGHGLLQKRWPHPLRPRHLAPLCGHWSWHPLLRHLEVPLPARRAGGQNVPIDALRTLHINGDMEGEQGGEPGPWAHPEATCCPLHGFDFKQIFLF
uniref:Monocyte to macrophage differentiation associated 2 n=1 Tax=Gallus gallus TaxID=9031 RepID=E1BQQ7_CHICK